jgi:hypothetical protein
MPVAVSADKKKPKIEQHIMKEYDVVNREVRIAGIVIAWNTLQHFYPYWDVVNANWESALNDALTKCARDNNADEYLETIRLLIMHLKDGHGFAYNDNTNYTKWKSIYAWAALAEGKIVVKKCTDCSSLGIKPGDEITAIDGVSALEIYEKEARIKSGSPQWKKGISIGSLLISKSGKKDSVTIELINEKGVSYTRKLPLFENWHKKEPFQYER